MFSLHETTQRRVCRVAFVLCAALPTLATLVSVGFSLRPWREADWQRTVSQELHVRASVEQVDSPRPGITQISKIQLSDLRTELPLSSLNIVQVRWNGSQLVLSVDELQVEAAQLPALAATVATWLSTDDLPAVELQAKRLTLVGSERRTLAFDNVRLQAERKDGQPKRLGIQSDSIRLLVEHKNKTVAALDTGSAHLPAWLLVDLLPSLSRCKDATFVGSLRLESNAQTLSGTLRGRFDTVALDQWIGPAAQHQVRGVATIELDQLQWRGAQLEIAQGRLRVPGGAASRSLLADLEKRLFCVLDPRFNGSNLAAEELATFDELACSFQLTEAGLTVAGQCQTLEEAMPGCVLAIGGRPLLLEPRYANLPVAQLVQVLSQPAASWLPASAEAHDMAGRLPLPSTRPEAVAKRPSESSTR